MLRIKALAARWGDAGIEYSVLDLKQHLGLSVSTTTVRKALKCTLGKVRAGSERATARGTCSWDVCTLSCDSAK